MITLEKIIEINLRIRNGKKVEVRYLSPSLSPLYSLSFSGILEDNEDEEENDNKDKYWRVSKREDYVYFKASDVLEIDVLKIGDTEKDREEIFILYLKSL